jgi:DNA-binding NarL/FixJ family response regulator
MNSPRARATPAQQVWIVEDSPPFRRSLQRLLSNAKLFHVHGYANAEAALAVLQNPGEGGLPDVLLLDIGLPGLSGLDLIPKISEIAPSCRILILTVFEDEEKIARSISAGACGYLLKTATPRQIIEGIQEAAEGGSPMSPKVAQNVVKLLARLMKPAAPPVGISPREHQLLVLMAKGLTAKEISDQLGISIHTTDTHTRNLFAKLGVHNRASAVARALQDRLV